MVEAANDDTYLLRPVGWVTSPLTDAASAPRQGDEGAPAAWLIFDARVERALRDLRVGAEVLVLTWLDRARRDVLAVHPRGDESRPETGVFSTRSPHRPNPIGLHRVRVLTVDGLRVQVADLEALDGTPVLDVKPVLGAVDER
ncbi:tRNA (N6-threonylcarbamoyladenosine(37)-N6)-methyltransferase TrmO [Micromonospora zamorensis]|uniref:tRNA (N6-threonylcarbamoyladenosine(37)-N6)-methyltransferase TrmO n=1 Tax=Micromonospora zamorensis TaxID=709883 RepID=UPI003CE7F44F